MGGVQSLPKHNFYITRVTNADLPVVPFLHTIVGFNNTPVKDTDPVKLKELLKTQSVCLEVLDVILNKRFTITIPMNGCNGDGKMGINVTKLTAIPVPLKAQITSIRETVETPLRIGDRIIGIDNVYVENEDELFFEIKSNKEIQLVVLRGDKVEVLGCTGPEIGCEVATGLIYTIPEGEYTMRGYTGKVEKVWTNTERSEGEERELRNAGSEGSVESMLASKESVNEESVNKESVSKESVSKESVSKELASKELASKNTTYDTNNNNQATESLNISKNNTEMSEEHQQESASFTSNNYPVVSKIQNDLNSEMADMSLNGNSSKDKQEPMQQPQIPNRISDRQVGLNVDNKDKTTSYSYVSPSAVSHNSEFVPINQTNESRIYEEAGLPLEAEKLKGTKDLHPREYAGIVNTSAVCGGDYTTKNGEVRMKDSVFSERKEAECRKNGGVNIFDDDDDQLPFDTKGSNISE